jgi:hypothetical protein
VNGFQMYDASTGEGSVRIVEHLIVRDGAIQSSAFITDTNAYMSLMAR